MLNKSKDGIFKIKKERDYASLSNSVLRDKSLSFQARGVLCYLLSRPANWRCSIQDLINQSPAGKSAVYATIRELEAAGYMKRIKYRAEKGQVKWITEVYEVPQPLTENR